MAALTDDDRKRICVAARSYQGVRWIPHGRSHNGIDCVGLMVMAYRDAGFPVDEGEPNYRGIDSKRLMRMLLNHCARIELKDALPADIVVYEMLDAGHVGILLDGANGGLNLIHAPAGRPAAEARFDPKRGKLRGVFRW